ncbi:uncharacterized protein BP5553_04317 [Venustampulla echinocandica]|uniref:PLD phosphodiesterase domain-containing protein n=1 Tax=Venustampulla echinocandica TaxID=2656787 RepID=A0A370TWS8_9HELO|nr:uncharacterized protein BP5553_04317 [Venustampulla echinocandica]RDL39977.1 hypothetical protein BP5553_04317 [Venustampulla echinocandica]
MASLPNHAVIDGWLNNANIPTEESWNNSNAHLSSPRTLITSSHPEKFSLGTGSQILTKVFSDCLETNHELIIVTCFWAKSPSQDAISSLLLKLSSKAIAQNRKIQVRICFSSRSILQKLFHTSSLDGTIYAPPSWPSLGLPSADDLTGINLVVKSTFVKPFSVMHPKFILMDRQLAYIPSANVSWEGWFEGCVEVRGHICERLFGFWSAFWSRGGASLPPMLFPDSPLELDTEVAGDIPELHLIKETLFSPKSPIPTILLPSSHHINPRFRLPWMSAPEIPHTPLNTFILHILNTANHNIFIQSPNFTSPPVLSALVSALKRGVSVHIVTSSLLMILEQLATAGTITEFEVWKLRHQYRNLHKSYQRTLSSDPETQAQKPGILRIGYYCPRQGVAAVMDEPVKTHLKLTIVDGEVVVLGSGNMDRASWYTSQELGVGFVSKDMASEVKASIEEGLDGRVIDYC